MAIFRTVWRADPVRIPLPSSDAGVLDPFEAGMRDRRARFGHAGWVGEIGDGRVKLGYRGRFALRVGFLMNARATNDAGPCLKGVYRKSWFSRIWRSLWFVGLLFLCLVTLATTFVPAPPPPPPDEATYLFVSGLVISFLSFVG